MSQTIQNILESYDANVIALALHLGYISQKTLARYPEQATKEEVNTLTEGLDIMKDYIDDGDYLSLTDEEADTKLDEQLDSYIDECIMPRIPVELQIYFDSSSWKRDARMDGRGHIISSYDGEEHEQEYNGTTYFIYRIN